MAEPGAGKDRPGSSSEEPTRVKYSPPETVDLGPTDEQLGGDPSADPWAGVHLAHELEALRPGTPAPATPPDQIAGIWNTREEMLEWLEKQVNQKKP